MELVATWWPAALAALVCLVLAQVVGFLTGKAWDNEDSEVAWDSAPGNVLYVVVYGAPIVAAVLVGPSPDPPTALVGVLAVVAGLGVWYILIYYLGRTRLRTRVASAFSLGAAIAAVLVLGWWLPAALGMTTALVVVGALGLVVLLPLLYVVALLLWLLITLWRSP